MRIITIRAPKGHVGQIVDLASLAGVDRVGVQSGRAIHKGKETFEEDVIEVHSATPRIKKLIEAVMESDFYDPKRYSFTIMHPESVFAALPPKKETFPIVLPSPDVYAELWQFSNITISLISRVFLSSVLFSYGMHESYMPIIIAGLLFLPYHHNLLGISAGAAFFEGRLFKQALLAFLVSTFCIIAGGMLVGLLMGSGIKFTAFETTYLKSFLISAVIGTAAGFGAIDDSGRRELIGLAATAHVSVYPAWFGMKFIFGFDTDDQPLNFLITFLLDVLTIIFFSALIFKLMKLKGRGIKKFVRHFTSA